MEFNINGTLVWYYNICHREVWLMAHSLVPDEHDDNVVIGRIIHEDSYKREKKEIDLGYVKFDLISRDRDGMVIGEVKKTSASKNAARMQLLFYLRSMRDAGFDAKGELHFPTEKKIMRLELTDAALEELSAMEADILRIVEQENPPQAEKIHFCSKCAYAEICWA